MTFLELKSLTVDLLPAVLELDRRCFGGLWSLAGYQRELASPNSELLVFTSHDDAKSEPYENVETIQSQSKILPLTPDSRLLTPDSRLLTPDSRLLTPPLIGLGCYWAILEEAHITILAIDPVYQRQGLGKAMLYALLLSAHQRGLERATLEVRISNQSAILLYKKFGFQAVGHRRRYYPDTGEDALVLWLNGLQSSRFVSTLHDQHQQISEQLRQFNWQLIEG